MNAVNDAKAKSDVLRSLGFQVTHLYDANLQQMNDAARQFGDRLPAGVGLFFYAGHGMQIRSKNFVIPVGSDIRREDEVQYKTFDANQLLDKMESARNPINIVILDACRRHRLLDDHRRAPARSAGPSDRRCPAQALAGMDNIEPAKSPRSIRRTSVRV